MNHAEIIKLLPPDITCFALLDDEVLFGRGWVFSDFKDFECALNRAGATWKNSATIYDINRYSDTITAICGQVRDGYTDGERPCRGSKGLNRMKLTNIKPYLKAFLAGVALRPIRLARGIEVDQEIALHIISNPAKHKRTRKVK